MRAKLKYIINKITRLSCLENAVRKAISQTNYQPPHILLISNCEIYVNYHLRDFSPLGELDADLPHALSPRQNIKNLWLVYILSHHIRVCSSGIPEG